MPMCSIAGPVISEHGCEFEFDPKVGLFYISDPAIGVRRAMFPNTFFATIARAAECSRQYRPWRGAEIVPFPHAAAASGSPSK